MVLWVTGGLFVREAAKLQRWHGFYPESVMKQVWPLLTVELGLFLLGRWDGSGGEGGPSAGIHCLALGAGLAIGAMVRNSAEEAQKAISFLPATLSAAVLVCAALTLGSGILYASGEGQFAAASSTMLVTTGRFIGDVGRAGLVHAAVEPRATAAASAPACCCSCCAAAASPEPRPAARLRRRTSPRSST
eukprot:SRR837773.13329.p3 GENE.SRR837773.13329~~SRR837773.13329.p3  ORF type:complete len:211 (+),score=65.36 SRR837773.13329:66-635(+)